LSELNLNLRDALPEREDPRTEKRKNSAFITLSTMKKKQKSSKVSGAMKKAQRRKKERVNDGGEFKNGGATINGGD